MNEFWGTVIPAALTAVAGIVVAWLSSRKPISIADQMKPFSDAIQSLDETLDADEIARLKLMRQALVEQQFDQNVANTGLSRVFYVATVAWSVPVFAGVVLWFWMVLSSPLMTPEGDPGRLNQQQVFDLGVGPASAGLVGLVILLGLFVGTYLKRRSDALKAAKKSAAATVKAVTKANKKPSWLKRS
jgi:hypothetical protein